MLGVLISLLGIMLAVGIPIYVALAGPSLVAIVIKDIPPLLFMQRMFGGIDRFSLMAIPFFILAANIMGKGGMSRRILALANVLVGRFYGGTAIGSTLACLLFGALSGSAPATVVAIGSITYPALLENGYGKKFSMGLVTSASSLAIIIPPSITMIVYAATTGTSVGELFMAGIGPGIFMGLCIMAYSVWYARKNDIRSTVHVPPGQVWIAIKDSSWAMGVPIIIIGGIYAGVFTPTESATVAAVYALIVGLFVYKELDYKSALQVCISSALTTAQVMILVAAASVLSWILTVNQTQLILQQAIEPFLSLPWAVLTIMNIMLLIAGMFMDAVPFTLLLAPLFVPIAHVIGLDLIHLGIIFTMNGAIGMFSPPFGLNIFVGMATYKEPFNKIAWSVVPFIIISIFALLVVTYVPELSLWIPHRIYGN
ncbi:TRAP transporter large permease [Desulfoscipio sp. XC116]|uniref:TRAP transporter large permease n=1 Tax=Desulfoscipio sp. XC116 TaxID=3144975 RepID=UPI00325A6DF7